MCCVDRASGYPVNRFQQEAAYNTCNGILCSLPCQGWNNRYSPDPETLSFCAGTCGYPVAESHLLSQFPNLLCQARDFFFYFWQLFAVFDAAALIPQVFPFVCKPRHPPLRIFLQWKKLLCGIDPITAEQPCLLWNRTRTGGYTKHRLDLQFIL